MGPALGRSGLGDGESALALFVHVTLSPSCNSQHI